MLFWRGWGICVFVVTFAWIFILIGIMIASGSHDPDAVRAAIFVDNLFALSFILSAVTVFFLVRYRENRPVKLVDPATGQTHWFPHTDEFMFIRMKYWTHILAALSVAMVIKSFFEKG